MCNTCSKLLLLLLGFTVSSTEGLTASCAAYVAHWYLLHSAHTTQVPSEGKNNAVDCKRKSTWKAVLSKWENKSMPYVQ